MVAKILKRDGILKVINYNKRKGRKVVMVSGSFDLLHAGHIEQLKNFRSRGDILIVLLNSDKSIKAYKGKNRPIVNQQNRAFTLSALSHVDNIFIFNELTPLRWIEIFKPDIYCNGGDWGKKFLEHDTIIKNNGSVYIAKRSKKDSTSGIIEKIKLAEKTPEIKAIFYFDKKLLQSLQRFSKKYLSMQVSGKNLLKFTKQKNIALGRSFVISDKLEEIEIGKMHNCKTIFIGKMPKKVASTEIPDFTIKNSKELKEII